MQTDADLHQKIKDLMFTFDNLMQVDDRGVQTLLREVSSDQLALALRGAEPAMQDKIFRNMSKRAGEILKDDMEARGPVKLTRSGSRAEGNRRYRTAADRRRHDRHRRRRGRLCLTNNSPDTAAGRGAQPWQAPDVGDAAATAGSPAGAAAHRACLTGRACSRTCRKKRIARPMRRG